MFSNLGKITATMTQNKQNEIKNKKYEKPTIQTTKKIHLGCQFEVSLFYTFRATILVTEFREM